MEFWNTNGVGGRELGTLQLTATNQQYGGSAGFLDILDVRSVPYVFNYKELHHPRIEISIAEHNDQSYM